MKFQAKYTPEVWAEVKLRYEAGESMNSIGRCDGMPKKQSIFDRANRERWERKVTDIPFPVSQPIRLEKFKDDRKQLILEALANGATYEVAAAKAGVTSQTLRDWRKADEAFGIACERVQGEDIGQTLAALQRMSLVDPATARWRTERHRLTRTDYAPPAGGGINIGVHFNQLSGVTTGITRGVTLDAEKC